MSARFSLSGIGERLASVERRLVSIVRPKCLWLILFLHGLHCRWQLIRPTWFCFLTVILVIAAFLVPQIQDVLLVAGEDTIQILLLFLGLLVFSVTAWYCARA